MSPARWSVSARLSAVGAGGTDTGLVRAPKLKSVRPAREAIVGNPLDEAWMTSASRPPHPVGIGLVA